MPKTFEIRPQEWWPFVQGANHAFKDGDPADVYLNDQFPVSIDAREAWFRGFWFARDLQKLAQ